MGEESVAWPAGGGEAFTQSLVTHWPRGTGPVTWSLGPQASSPAQPLDSLSPLLPSASRFLEGTSEGHKEGPGLRQKSIKS